MQRPLAKPDRSPAALARRPLRADLLCALGSNEHRKAGGGGD